MKVYLPAGWVSQQIKRRQKQVLCLLFTGIRCMPETVTKQTDHQRNATLNTHNVPYISRSQPSKNRHVSIEPAVEDLLRLIRAGTSFNLTFIDATPDHEPGLSHCSTSHDMWFCIFRACVSWHVICMYMCVRSTSRPLTAPPRLWSVVSPPPRCKNVLSMLITHLSR